MQSHLCVVGPQQRAHGLAPSLRVVAEFLEVFLECQPHLCHVASCRRHLGHRIHHGVHRSVEWRPTCQVGVEAIRHYCHRVALPVEKRKLRHHALRGRQLIFASKGHHHSPGAYRRIEHLHQPFLRAYVEVVEGLYPHLSHRRWLVGVCFVHGFV